MFPYVSEVAEYAGRTKGRAAYSLNSGREDVKRGGLFRDHSVNASGDRPIDEFVQFP